MNRKVYTMTYRHTYVLLRSVLNIQSHLKSSKNEGGSSPILHDFFFNGKITCDMQNYQLQAKKAKFIGVSGLR